MKSIFVSLPLMLMCAFGSLASAADLQSELLANEKMFYTTKDAAVLGKMLTEDAVEITSEHVLNGREAVAKAAAEGTCKESNLEFRDAKMRQLSQDVVILLFTAAYDEDCDGKKESVKNAVSSIWQQQNGKWLSSIYHSSRIK